ncbi:MAG: hypothetical protein ACKO1M_10110 [Planctomycetota bacterium]
MMPAGWLLVAAGLDWLDGLLPVLFVLIWIVSQVMNLFRGAAKKPADVPAAPVRRPPRPAAGGEAADNRGDSLDGEIEEFLRRTLERTPQPQPGPTVTKPPRPRRQPRRAATPPPVPAGGRAAGPVVERGDVAGHVATAFAHDLAHASPDRTVVAPPAQGAKPSPASELVAALRAPGGLRQLILMREVLERPTHRW